MEAKERPEEGREEVAEEDEKLEEEEGEEEAEGVSLLAVDDEGDLGDEAMNEGGVPPRRHEWKDEGAALPPCE